MAKTERQVMVWPRGQLSTEDRRRLRDVGIVAVEADDPTKVVTVIPSAGILTGDDVSLAAYKAIRHADYNDVRVKFANNLVERALARETDVKRENSSEEK